MPTAQQIKESLEEEARSLKSRMAQADVVEAIEDVVEQVVENVNEKSLSAREHVVALLKSPSVLLNEVRENLPSAELFIKVSVVLAFWNVAQLLFGMLF